MAFALTDLTTLKERLGVKPANTTEDATLTGLIASVSSQIASLTNRVDGIEEKSRVEIKDVRPGQRWFRMKAVPIVSVTTVEYDPFQSFGTSSEIDSGNFLFKPATGELYFHFDLVGVRDILRPQALQITYVGGLGTTLAAVRTALPELEHYAVEWIKLIWKRKRTNPQRISISGQGGSVTIEDMALPPEIRNGLRRLRRPNVG